MSVYKSLLMKKNKYLFDNFAFSCKLFWNKKYLQELL